MKYEEANANSWTALLGQEAHTFMVNLQGQLRLWEVLAENDQTFVAALHQVGADLAWAFDGLIRRPDVPGALNQGLDTHSGQLAALVQARTAELQNLAADIERQLGQVGLRAARRILDEVLDGMEAAQRLFDATPQVGTHTTVEKRFTFCVDLVEEEACLARSALEDCLSITEWETRIGLEQLGAVAFAASRSWLPHWSQREVQDVVSKIADRIPLPDEIWAELDGNAADTNEHDTGEAA